MLQGARTAIAVSLTEETTAAVVDRMAALAPVADLFEVRADFVRDLDLAALLTARTKPILFTCRPGVGGRPLPGPRPRGPPAPAVRGGRPRLRPRGRGGPLRLRRRGRVEGGAGARRSRGTTSRARRTTSTAIHDRMAAQHPDVVKIAVTARSVADLGRLLAFAVRRAAAAARGSSPSPWARWASPRGSSAAATARPSRSPRPRTVARRPPASCRRPCSPTRTASARSRPRRGSTASSARTSCAASRPRSRTAPSPSGAIDAVYVPLQAESMGAFVSALPALDLSGFSVTRPYKGEILPYLDSVTPNAAEARSANTVVVQDGRLVGLSTDGDGVLVPLRRRLDPARRVVAIVGAGGAARAAAFALVRAGRARHRPRAARRAGGGGGGRHRLRLGRPRRPSGPPVGRAGERHARRLGGLPGPDARPGEGAPARGRRVRHGLRAARDAAPRGREGEGLRRDRRRRDARGAGRRAVRGLDGRSRRRSRR